MASAVWLLLLPHQVQVVCELVKRVCIISNLMEVFLCSCHFGKSQCFFDCFSNFFFHGCVTSIGFRHVYILCILPLWALRHLGWTIALWNWALGSQIGMPDPFFERNGHSVLKITDEKDRLNCEQQEVKKPGSVVWGFVHLWQDSFTSLLWEDYCRKVHWDFKGAYTTFKMTCFSKDVLAFFNKTM